MDDEFEIPVNYKGELLLFPARLVQLGYTHRFEVNVKDQIIFFEPDEERNYRALIDWEQVANSSTLNVELLKSIAVGIEDAIK